jgi:sugar phosphate isomerase/epimerase
MTMDLHLMRHLWGVTEPWDQAFPRFKEAGYRGIDALPPGPEDRDRFRRLLHEYGFSYILQVLTTGDTVEAHVASFRQQVDAGLELEPFLIGCHGGRDAWSDDESARFFEQVLRIEQEVGIPVGHETHRGRILYNPWVTSRMLARFPDLKLVCDFSHWTCVAERLLDDQTHIIRQSAGRCIHLHARVGYPEGPQVPDPRAPEYRGCLETFEAWWDLVWDAQEAHGMAVSTLTPEYGPPGYLHTLPYTRQPVADLAEVCDWQAQRAAERFANRRQVSYRRT